MALILHRPVNRFDFNRLRKRRVIAEAAFDVNENYYYAMRFSPAQASCRHRQIVLNPKSYRRMQATSSVVISVFRYVLLAALLVMVWGRPAYGAEVSPNLFDHRVLHPAIPLLDESGKHVLDSGLPYSTKMSCGNGAGGGCHDYEKMNHAYHFEQGRDESGDDFGKKRGLPHLVSPGYFGGYNCMQGSSTGALSKKSNANVNELGDWGAAGSGSRSADASPVRMAGRSRSRACPAGGRRFACGCRAPPSRSSRVARPGRRSGHDRRPNSLPRE
jgi:hypothetical protein